MACQTSFEVVSSFSRSNVQFESCSLGDSEVSPGGSTTVTFTVRNDNDEDADVGFNIEVGEGGELFSHSEVIPANSSVETTVEIQPTEEGDHEVTVWFGNVGKA